MENGIKKFRELLFTDEEFRQKLKAATEAYTGEQTEEAFFNNVLTPLAQEYGITGTFEEFNAYFEKPDGQEMEMEDLAQVAGGGKGFGIGACASIGIGLGGITKGDTFCGGVGFGGGQGLCAGPGI